MVHALFTPSRSSSPPRLPHLPQPVDTNFPSGPTPALDISPFQNTSLHQYDNDVVRELSLPPASAYSSTNPRPRNHQSNGSSSHPPAHPSHNVSIESFTRPRTPSASIPHPSFSAHHGLPQSLPPPPRTTFYNQGQLVPPPAKDPEVSNIASYFDSLLRGSYSTMLSQNPESTINDSAADPHRPVAELELTLDDMMHADYLDATNFEEYLTSPLIQDDSPEETPFLPTPGEDAWNTSPMVDAGDDSFGLTDMPLFGAVVKQATDAKATSPETESLLKMLQLCSPQLNFDKMDSVTPALDPLDAASLITMPATPAMPPSALYNSPHLPFNAPSSSSSSATPPRPTKPLPTGTRRNITPAALVPIDAPTQPRQYVTPSVTSRKAIPAAFKGKKRARSEVEPDAGEDDEEVDPDAIEAKRRQNTLAARRSRQRKLEHVRELEETVGRLTDDRDVWMQRAYVAEEKLRTHGIA